MSTIAFVHAHPDDEALLTAGTMRALHERGHRVILIMATDGGAGLTSESLAEDLAGTRASELTASAHVLGVAKTYWLGYADSGLDGNAVSSHTTWVGGEQSEQVAAVRNILLAELPAVVVSYDRAGGYGHPDHVRVHHVVEEAAKQANIPTLLEATVDRQSIARMLDFFRPLIKIAKAHEVLSLADGFSARADIGYVIDTRRWTSPKRASMRAHASQTTGGSTPRTLAILLAIPRPVFKRILNREWYRVAWNHADHNPFDDLPHAK